MIFPPFSDIVSARYIHAAGFTAEIERFKHRKMRLQASVIIPVRNGENVLSRCLEALRRQGLPADAYEIIVVDDGSEDATATVAEQAGARVVRQDPSGPSVARNRGVEEARAPIVLFTDADCAPEPDWLEKMLAPFADEKVVGVKGSYLTDQQSLVARFVQREYEAKYERMKKFPRIDFIDTYSAGFRRQAFLDAGGYDPAYSTASVEDQEFSFRLHEKGAVMLFVPGARVRHYHVDSFRGYLRKKCKIGYYKALLLIQHPGKIQGDSHTPGSLQVQLVAVYGALISALLIGPAAVLWPPAAGIVALVGGMGILVFLGSALPFIAGLVQKRDWPVLMIAPVLLLGRAMALGWGLLWGSIDFGFRGRGRIQSIPAPQSTAGKDVE